MKVADIGRLVRYKLLQHSRKDMEGQIVLLDHQLEAVSSEIAAELSLRITRPVVTFSRGDVLDAAAAAGYQIVIRSQDGNQYMVPVDERDTDVYDRVHKVMEKAYSNVLESMPERMLQMEAQAANEQG